MVHDVQLATCRMSNHAHRHTCTRTCIHMHAYSCAHTRNHAHTQEGYRKGMRAITHRLSVRERASPLDADMIPLAMATAAAEVAILPVFSPTFF